MNQPIYHRIYPDFGRSCIQFDKKIIEQFPCQQQHTELNAVHVLILRGSTKLRRLKLHQSNQEKCMFISRNEFRFTCSFVHKVFLFVRSVAVSYGLLLVHAEEGTFEMASLCIDDSLNLYVCSALGIVYWNYHTIQYSR